MASTRHRSASVLPITRNDQGSLGQDHGADGRRGGNLELQNPLNAFFDQTHPHVTVIIPVIMKHWHNKDAGNLSWLSSAISVLSVSFVLHLVETIFTREVRVRCWLAYGSVFLRIVAGILLLLFLDPVSNLVVTLPLSLLVLVLLAYLLKTFISDWPPGRDYNDHEAELKRWFGLSSQVVTIAFAGLLGTVLGYVKGSSNQLLSGRGYRAPDSLLLYSVVLGLLVQLFSTVPPFIFVIEKRKNMAEVYLRFGAYASLMFFVLAGVIAAEQILREWAFIPCCIILIIFLVCLRDTNESRDVLREEDRFAQFVLPVITLLFAALMASNSKYGVETGTAVSLSGWFKVSVLSVFYGVLSYAGRMVFSSDMTRRCSLFHEKVWTCSTLAAILITIHLVACAAYMHPDEIENIYG